MLLFSDGVEFGVVGGPQGESSYLLCSYINSVAHLISPAFRSVASGDLSFPLSVTNLTTNCSPMFWNKRVKFSTSRTVLEWDSHMLIISFPLVSYISMQFSECHAGHLETGLRLRNPDILYPFSISGQTPLPCSISDQSLSLDHHFCSHPVETVLYKYFRCGNHGIILHPLMGTDEYSNQRQDNKMLCQCRRLYSPSCATSVSFQRCKDLPMHFFSF